MIETQIETEIQTIEAFYPLYEMLYRYYVFYGGRGGSKSWGVADFLIQVAVQSPFRILCVREIQRSIKDSVHKLLSDRIFDHGLDDEFIITDTSIRSRAGAEFLFKGLFANINAIKSTEGIDIVWAEESESISRMSIDILIPTIRKPGSFLIFTFNPENAEDAVYQDFIVNPPPNAYIKKLNWYNNPFFPDVLQEELERCRRHDMDRFQWIWEGELKHISEANVFSGRWVIDRFDRATLGSPIYGLDFGFAQSPTVLIELFEKDNVLYVSREIHRTGLEIDHTADLAMKRMPGIQKYKIRADNARPESISYLKREKGKLQRITACEKGKGSVEDGVEFMKTFDKIVIHPDCPNTAIDFKNYSYEVDKRTGDVLPKIVKKWDDSIDAIRYGLEPMMKGKGKMPDISI